MRHTHRKHHLKEGDVFSKLTIVKEVDPLISKSGNEVRAFLCKCECGNEKIMMLKSIIRKESRGCGCGNGKPVEKKNRRLYTIYHNMKSRCAGQSTIKHHKYYRDKGIELCKEWEEDVDAFIKFAWDNGYNDTLTIDRKDGNKGYCPENCRFVGYIEQNNNLSSNRIIEYQGIKDTIPNTLRRIGSSMLYVTVLSRLRIGMDIQDAIEKPLQKGKKHN